MEIDIAKKNAKSRKIKGANDQSIYLAESEEKISYLKLLTHYQNSHPTVEL